MDYTSQWQSSPFWPEILSTRRLSILDYMYTCLVTSFGYYGDFQTCTCTLESLKLSSSQTSILESLRGLLTVFFYNLQYMLLEVKTCHETYCSQENPILSDVWRILLTLVCQWFGEEPHTFSTSLPYSLLYYNPLFYPYNPTSNDQVWSSSRCTSEALRVPAVPATPFNYYMANPSIPKVSHFYNKVIILANSRLTCTIEPIFRHHVVTDWKL